MTGPGMELMSSGELGAQTAHDERESTGIPEDLRRVHARDAHDADVLGYVVVGGPPRKPEIMVDRPSPASERGNNGR